MEKRPENAADQQKTDRRKPQGSGSSGPSA